MRFRLSLLMFLQFAGLGGFYPIFSHYLINVLHFSGTEAGLISSAYAVALIIAPIGGAFIADRLISSAKFFALCHFAGALCMLLLYRQTAFLSFLTVYLLYSMAAGCTIGLANAIAFQFYPGATSRRQFVGVRMWGTIGWIAAGWAFGYGWLRSSSGLASNRVADAFILSAACSIVLVILALTLPRSGQEPAGRPSLFPREAWAVLRQPPVTALLLLAFAASLVDRYFFFGAAPYLKAIGFSEAAILPAMSLGQVVETGGMLMLAALLTRFGFKIVLLCGIFTQFLRCVIFALSDNHTLVLTALACHGFSYALFFTSAYIYLDRRTSVESRAGAHLIFTLIVSGLASFAGSNLGGVLIDYYQGSFEAFWAVPAVVAGLCFAAGLKFFPGGETPEEASAEAIPAEIG